MKASKIHLLFLLTLALAANAAQVDESTARLAAGSWALSNASFGVPHGKTVSEVTSYDVDGSIGFYAVALEGGGTLFLAADDEIGPVLAFTAESDPDLSAESPLFNLLNRDIMARRGIVEAEAAQTVSTSRMLLAATGSSTASQRGDSAQRAQKLWAAFTATSSQSSVRQSGGRIRLGATANAREDNEMIDSDIRVEPILTTQWSQTKDRGGNNCYNYYTTNNYPCGCVATASGQILNKWQYPTEELPQFSEYCTVDGSSVQLDSIGQTRIYNWSAMVDKPSGATSDESRQAIGALLADLGIAFKADYTSTGTGAFEYDVPGPLHEHFKYASAYTYTSRANMNNLALHTAPMRQRTILANLDAKRPVELYIMSNTAGGHAVVADGYGYVTIGDEAVEFTHINMGWAGTDDMWYNLPIIKTKEAGSTAGQSGGYVFEYLMAATFNIHPTETGDLLTGRITDDDEPVAGATVSVRAAGSTVDIATTTSDARGIYSFCLEGGKSYDVVAVSADGKKTGTLGDVSLKKTTISNTDTYTTYDEDDVGNSWGNDIDIVVPHVRIVGEGVYQNLNDALSAAAEMTDPVVEIFGPVRLKAPVTITTNVTIRTVPAPSADYPDPTFDDCAVIVVDDAVTDAGWALQVADGVRVAFSNVVFTAESGELPYVDVMETGTASVAGKIGIGTVKVQDAGGFVLAGAFEPVGGVLAVACPVATDRFSLFGTYECAKNDASSCVGFIVNALDQTLMGSVGNNPGALVWDRVPVDPSAATAYATNDEIGKTYYRSLDLLFKDYAGGADVVVLRDCDADAFTVPVLISNSVTIASADGSTFAVTATKDIGFSVTNGAELVFTNVVFTRSGSGTQNFVTLNDGSFVLDDGAVIKGLSLAGTASAVYVNKGSVTMRGASAITNCVGTSGHTGYGAAVYLKGADCSMNFQGGTITGCQAGHGSGAAVYAGTGAKIDVSGSASAHDNSPCDVYFYQSSVFTLVGPLTGNVGVYCGNGYKENRSFATIGAGVSQDAARLACAHFLNNMKPELSAAVSNDGKTFVWATDQTGPKPVPEADAVARLVLNDASDTYASIDDALEMAGEADARIELLKDTSLVKSLPIKGSVVLDGMGKTLTRDGDFYLAVTNSTLTLTNLVMDGGVSLGGLGRILDVYGGSLTLEAGTRIYDVYGGDQSMVAPIVVWNGSFLMMSSAEISDCVNLYEPAVAGSLTAGAVLINGQDANAEFRGGTVRDCMATRAGGVYVGNKANVRVGGDTRIKGNIELVTGEESNLVVQDMSGLVLADILTGRVGYTEGVFGNTNMFGRIDADFAASTTASNLVVSARRFIHDKTAAKGMVATNETEAILVWSNSVDGVTQFTNNVDGVTTVYDVVLVEVDDDDPEIVVCAPFAFAAIEEVSPGKWKLTLKPGTEYCIYTLKSSSDLETWTTVGTKTLSADDINADLEFIFETTPDSGIKRFWKVEGANGTK